MKFNHLTFLIALLFLGLLVAAVVFLGDKARKVQDVQDDIGVRTEKSLVGFLPITEKSAEVSIQKSKNGKTAELSWDNAQFRVFHIVALDGELFRKGEPSIVWQISSISRFPTASDDNFKKEDVSGFISSPYALGDTVQGMTSFEVPGEFQLQVGKQYYVQLIGFVENNKNVTINKEFTFTPSCLPPGCK